MLSWSISKEILLNLAIFLKVKIETKPVLKGEKKGKIININEDLQILQMDP